MTSYLSIQTWITSLIFIGFNILRIIGAYLDYWHIESNDIVERFSMDLNIAVIGSHPILSIIFSLILIVLDVLLIPGILRKRRIFLILWIYSYSVVLTLIIAKLFITCGWFVILLVTGRIADSLSILSSFAVQGLITLINVNSWEFVKCYIKILEKKVVPVDQDEDLSV